MAVDWPVDPVLALGVHLLVAGLVLVAALGVAALVREPGRERMGIYESGAPAGPTRIAPVPASTFLIALCFMIFDVEAALLFAWAVAATEVGRSGLVAATIFVLLLLAALVYLWLDGALETGSMRQQTKR